MSYHWENRADRCRDSEVVLSLSRVSRSDLVSTSTTQNRPNWRISRVTSSRSCKVVGESLSLRNECVVSSLILQSRWSDPRCARHYLHWTTEMSYPQLSFLFARCRTHDGGYCLAFVHGWSIHCRTRCRSHEHGEHRRSIHNRQGLGD